MLMTALKPAAPSPPIAFSWSVVVSRSKRPDGLAVTGPARAFSARTCFSACFCAAAAAATACCACRLIRADTWWTAVFAISSTRVKLLLGATCSQRFKIAHLAEQIHGCNPEASW